MDKNRTNVRGMDAEGFVTVTGKRKKVEPKPGLARPVIRSQVAVNGPHLRETNANGPPSQLVSKGAAEHAQDGESSNKLHNSFEALTDLEGMDTDLDPTKLDPEEVTDHQRAPTDGIRSL